MKIQCVCFFAASIIISLANGFRPIPRAFRSNSLFAEQGVNLGQLTDYENDSEFLCSSIRKWLDDEYVKQPVHDKIGNLCGAIYKSGRKNGITDLGEMLMEVGTQLEGADFEDAFVNCWDVANKVSDLLMVRMDRELCACMGDMSSFANAKIPSSLKETMDSLSSEFERYVFLQKFLDVDLPLESIQPVMAVCLGFRDHPDSSSTKQDEALAPLGWEGLAKTPNFADVDDSSVDLKLQEDLPEDPGGVDIFVETLIGLEHYKLMKRSTQAHVQRRILIVKWLYAQSFINDFPHQTRFVPKHLEYRMEDE